MNSIKLIASGLLLVLAIALIMRWHHSVYAAGEAHIQALWDDDKLAIQSAADKAIAQATKDKEAALEANGVIHDQYETELLTARALNSGLSAKLQQYQARLAASSGSVRAAGSGSGSSDTAPQPPSQSAVDAVLGAYDTACQADAAQLAALEAEIKPQL